MLDRQITPRYNYRGFTLNFSYFKEFKISIIIIQILSTSYF